MDATDHCGCQNKLRKAAVAKTGKAAALFVLQEIMAISCPHRDISRAH